MEEFNAAIEDEHGNTKELTLCEFLEEMDTWYFGHKDDRQGNNLIGDNEYCTSVELGRAE